MEFSYQNIYNIRYIMLEKKQTFVPYYVMTN